MQYDETNRYVVNTEETELKAEPRSSNTMFNESSAIISQAHFEEVIK